MNNLAEVLNPVSSVKAAPSKIHGKGIFASKTLPGGKVILALKKVQNTGKPDKDWERTVVGRFTNHADSPNMDVRRAEDMVFFVTKKPTKSGTELTVSYGAVEMAMSDVLAGLQELGSPSPVRRRLLKLALGIICRTLARDGIKAYVPKETKGFHMDLHVDVKSKEEAAMVAAKLERLFGMEVKKRHANGTHLLFLPHLIAVTVNPKKK
jgi:hypothetical protein